MRLIPIQVTGGHCWADEATGVRLDVFINQMNIPDSIGAIWKRKLTFLPQILRQTLDGKYCSSHAIVTITYYQLL
jgi:hypothetical protein